MNNPIKKTIRWHGFNKSVSVSDIEIHENNGCFLIIATERGDNTGTSITNGAEYLYPYILSEFKLNKSDCIFVESYYSKVTNQFSYDQVFLEKETKWRNIFSFDMFLKEFQQPPESKSRLDSIQ